MKKTKEERRRAHELRQAEQEALKGKKKAGKQLLAKSVQVHCLAVCAQGSVTKCKAGHVELRRCLSYGAVPGRAGGPEVHKAIKPQAAAGQGCGNCSEYVREEPDALCTHTKRIKQEELVAWD